MLLGVDSVEPFSIVNVQYELNLECSFNSSIVYFASVRPYHKNLYIYTVAAVKGLCGCLKRSPRTSFIVQLSLLYGLSSNAASHPEPSCLHRTL